MQETIKKQEMLNRRFSTFFFAPLNEFNFSGKKFKIYEQNPLKIPWRQSSF